MALEFSLVALALFLTAFLVNVLLKWAGQSTRWGRHIRCRVCDAPMERAQLHWSYQLPYMVGMVVSRHNLRPNEVKRYLCPMRHTQAWQVYCPGDRHCEVLVIKDYFVG